MELSWLEFTRNVYNEAAEVLTSTMVAGAAHNE